MIDRPDPDALMAGELGQWLRAQEADRAAVRAKVAARRRMVFFGVAVVAVLAILWFGDFAAGVQFGLMALMAGLAWVEWTKRPMIKRMKGGINGAIAKALGLNYAVDVEPGQTFALAKQFDMVPSYENASFHDLWWGVLGKRPFTMHEAKLTEQRGSGKNRRTVTVFEGSIMSLGFARMFHGTTLVEGDGRRRKFLIGAEKEDCEIGGVPLTRADMVDPRFEDRFTIWTNDQTEARYLVHPEYVERLLKVEAAFAGKNIRALFHEGELLIVLETGDLFESGSLDSSEDRQLLAKAIDQFGTLGDLAIELNERERTTMRSN